MWRSTLDRRDLLFPTRYLSQFANEKRCTLQKVFDAAVQVAQYGEHTADRGLDFSLLPDELAKYDGSFTIPLMAHSDSDHAIGKSSTEGLGLVAISLLRVCLLCLFVSPSME